MPSFILRNVEYVYVQLAAVQALRLLLNKLRVTADKLVFTCIDRTRTTRTTSETIQVEHCRPRTAVTCM